MNPNAVLVQNNSVYSDYESALPAVNWCTPSFMGFNICVNASASGGVVTLQLTLNTPFGSYSKTFNFNSNVCFEWGLPIRLGPSVKVCVTNLSTSPNVSFTLSLELCITLPIIGKKCVKWSHDFRLPFAAQHQLGAANVSAEDMSTLFLLMAHNAGDDAGSQCNCH